MGTLRNSLTLWRGGILSLLLFCFTVGFVSAQQRTITGKVTSKEEGALPGVNIQLQGTTRGAVTDNDGNFSLTVPGPEAVLIFSYVGYTSQTVTVGNQSVINVELQSESTALGEIVVIGYGTQKKNEVTSAIATVRSDQFNKGSVSDPVQLIQGKVSGLSISKPGGDPNGTYNIRLRGLSTIGANQAPLVVIDGVIGGSLDNVDPNDIESINVLKDASSAAIYGTRGSSGVILVTTKKGKAGSAQIEYNGYVTVETVAKNTPVMNASEWRKLRQEVADLDTTHSGINNDFGHSTDWFKAIEQTAVSQVHNLSMSGGTEKTSYRASINYRDETGVMITTGNTQINGRLNLSQKALNDKLTVNLDLGATEKNSSIGFPGAFRYATIYNPTAPITSTDPAYTKYGGYFQQEIFDCYNPVAILKLDQDKKQNKLLNASIRGTYQLAKGLSVSAFYALQTEAILESKYQGKYEYAYGYGHNGLATQKEDNSKNQLFEAEANYSGNIMPDLTANAVLAYSYNEAVFNGFGATGGNFITDVFTYNNLGAAQEFNHGLGSVSSYKNSYKDIGFVGRLNLAYKETYFLSASARYEGNSKFGKNNKWGVFPGISGGVELSKFLNVSAIDNLKVRANYGVVGNTPEDSYLSLMRLGPQGNFLYNGEWGPAYGPVSNANPDLKWEKTSSFDVGVDFSFFGSKLYGSVDYYIKNTKDILFYFQVPSPPNLYTYSWLNLGQMRSSGIELTVNYNVLKKSDLSYTVTLSPSYNLENTLVSLSGTYNGAKLEYGVKDLSDMGSPGQNQVPLTRVQEGKPIGQLLALKFKGVGPDGILQFEDINKDGKIDQADRTIVGNGLPKLLLGWGNNFTYKNWDMNVFFRGVFGHDLINSFRGFYEVPMMTTSYNVPKTTADMRNKQTGALMVASQGILSSWHVENASFFCLDNMSLGYNFKLPASLHISKIRLYLAGNRLFYITKYKGVDPEPRYVDSATDMGTYNSPLVPGVDRRDTWFRTRSVTFGANIVF